MNIIHKTIKDIHKFREFIWVALQTALKVDLSNTYLAYLWWILDPLTYMGVYVLVVHIILKRGGPDYPVFIFCALIPWRWLARTITTTTNSIRVKRTILHQIYLPKHILPLIDVLVNTIYFLLSLIVLIVVVLLYNKPLSFHMLEVIPIMLVQLAFTYSLGLWLAHIGVYFYDIDNILAFAVRIWFYLSPAIYSLDTVPEKYRFLWKFNPMTLFFEFYRNIFLYQKSPNYYELIIILGLSLIVVYTGLIVINKNDRKYTKVL